MLLLATTICACLLLCSANGLNQARKPIPGSRLLGSWSLLPRETRRKLKIAFVAGLITFEGATEIYCRLPQKILYGSDPPALEPAPKSSERDVVLIFPGAAGPDADSKALEEKIKASDRQVGLKRYVNTYDWKKWRGSFVRAAFDGQHVGTSVCTDLARLQAERGEPLQSLHAIGISVGAFAADSCVKAYSSYQAPNEARGARAAETKTILTLLDPFTSKGIFGYGWGIKNFGRCADVVEQYLNRDDPVPTTNEPLKLGVVYDVTDSKLKKEWEPAPKENGHSWPVVYLAKTWRTVIDSRGKLVHPVRGKDEGKVIVVP